jgi:hypothetical protein
MTGFSNRAKRHDGIARRPLIRKTTLDKYRAWLIMTHSHWTLLITNYHDYPRLTGFFPNRAKRHDEFSTRRPLIRKTTLDKYRQVLIMTPHTELLITIITNYPRHDRNFKPSEAPWWCSTRRPWLIENNSWQNYRQVLIMTHFTRHYWSQCSRYPRRWQEFQTEAKRHDGCSTRRPLIRKKTLDKITDTYWCDAHTRHCDHELSRIIHDADRTFKPSEAPWWIARLGDDDQKKQLDKCRAE